MNVNPITSSNKFPSREKEGRNTEKRSELFPNSNHPKEASLNKTPFPVLNNTKKDDVEFNLELSNNRRMCRRNSYDMSEEDFEVSKTVSEEGFDQYFQSKYKYHESDKVNCSKGNKSSGNDYKYFDYNPDVSNENRVNPNEFKKKNSVNSEEYSTDGSYPEGNPHIS